jgi:hypothetical protein
VGAGIPARRTATAIGSTGRTGLGERSSTGSCAAGREAEILRAAGCAAVRGSRSQLSVRNSATSRGLRRCLRGRVPDCAWGAPPSAASPRSTALGGGAGGVGPWSPRWRQQDVLWAMAAMDREQKK